MATHSGQAAPASLRRDMSGTKQLLFNTILSYGNFLKDAGATQADA
jgi:hypothetical protein